MVYTNYVFCVKNYKGQIDYDKYFCLQNYVTFRQTCVSIILLLVIDLYIL